MRVTVYHNVSRDEAGRPLGMLDGYREEHIVTPVAAYDVPDRTCANDLNEAWEVFNVGDDPAFGRPDDRAVEYRSRGNRSLSVGDVVSIGDRFYACRSIGWSEISKPDIRTHATYGTAPIELPE